MGDGALGGEPSQHRLDRRHRPAALRLEPLPDVGGRERLIGGPQHLHEVELGIGYALVYRHFVYICKRVDYSCKR